MDEVFDHDGALRRVGDDPELLAELVELFLEECPTHLAAVRAAIADSNAEALEHEAHAMKGAAGNVGADGVQAAARRMEVMGRSRMLDGAAPALGALEDAVELARTTLTSFLRRREAAA
ncbi:MAG: Hpt domain-containing protein [Myxococcales bacterium]|nr:Hpt domain-containing protein [Myxococcales bacterium]